MEQGEQQGQERDLPRLNAEIEEKERRGRLLGRKLDRFECARKAKAVDQAKSEGQTPTAAEIVEKEVFQTDISNRQGDQGFDDLG